MVTNVYKNRALNVECYDQHDFCEINSLNNFISKIKDGSFDQAFVLYADKYSNDIGFKVASTVLLLEK
jgi:hypothetical protein